MHFNFDPALQNIDVQEQRFPATPAMVAFETTASGWASRSSASPAAATTRRRHPSTTSTKVGYNGFTREPLLHQVDGVGATSSRPTSPAPPPAARRSSTRRAPASTSRTTSATRSRSTWATSGPTCRAGTPTTRSSCRTRPTTCRRRPARRQRAAAGSAHPLHDGGRRLERRDAGRRGHPEHRLGEEDDRHLLRRPRHRHLEQGRLALHPRDALDRRSTQAPRIAGACYIGRSGTKKPAMILDADDTNLWTYDMEVAAMHFNFDPVLQNEWVQDQRFPATPSMATLEKPPRRPDAPSSASPVATTTRRRRPSATSPRSVTPASPRRTTTRSGPASARRSSRRTSPARP